MNQHTNQSDSRSSDDAATIEQPSQPGCSSLTAVSLPWVLTQRDPLDTDDLIREAERRGFCLDLSTLRELYRHRLLIPFIAVSDRRVAPAIVLSETEPARASTRLMQLREARSSGKLQDLSTIPFRSRLPFERTHQRSHLWWNGLLYSWHQLHILPELQGVLARRWYGRRGERLMARLPIPESSLAQYAARLRMVAIAATALEARYLPVVDAEWIHLTNAEPDEWREYRAAFDAVAVSKMLSYTAKNARDDAELLLLRAHSIDPVGSSWSRLMRRAPRESWKELKNAALSAIDFRETAEILLLFYEDLASQGQAEPLPTNGQLARWWHPLHKRLSYRRDTLDQELMHLGISPHPRVILAVEGDTEQVHAPRVWKALGHPPAPELVRILKLGTVDRDLQKVAALAVAPLVGRREETQEFWWLIKPPTQLLIAVDPEGRYFAPHKVDRTRTILLNEIKSVLQTQGAKTKDEELDQLIEIRTWSQRCYEFAHFSDPELADAIMAVHHTTDGLTRETLIASLAATRNRHKDIDEVWSRWSYKVSKVKLANALWPTLEQKIERAKADSTAPIPEIVDVVQHAYFTAQRWRYKSFVLVGAD
jgi:hypothetical protein